MFTLVTFHITFERGLKIRSLSNWWRQLDKRPRLSRLRKYPCGGNHNAHSSPICNDNLSKCAHVWPTVYGNEYPDTIGGIQCQDHDTCLCCSCLCEHCRCSEVATQTSTKSRDVPFCLFVLNLVVVFLQVEICWHVTIASQEHNAMSETRATTPYLLIDISAVSVSKFQG